nr:DNA alkylation repair protein [Chloroflexota bacterium]
RRGREPDVAIHGLGLIRELIGDAEPDVQKALAWALRSMAGIDRTATTKFLEAEAKTAAGTDDGHRAWVIRDTLPKIDEADGARIRVRLTGIHRRAGVSSTSRAAETAARFGKGILGHPMPEPPLV